MNDKTKKFLEYTLEAGRLAKDICQTEQAVTDIRHHLRCAQALAMGQSIMATRMDVCLVMDGLVNGK